MRRLALFVVHRRWVVIILAAIFLPLAAAIGGGVAQKLTVGGLEDPASESARTAAEIQQRFANAGQSDFVVLVTARDGNVDAPGRPGRRVGAHQEALGRAGDRLGLFVLERGQPRSAQERRREAGADLRVGEGGPRQEGEGRQGAVRAVHDEDRGGDHCGHGASRDRPAGEQAGRRGPQALGVPHRPDHLPRADRRLRWRRRRAAAAQCRE